MSYVNDVRLYIGGSAPTDTTGSTNITTPLIKTRIKTFRKREVYTAEFTLSKKGFEDLYSLTIGDGVIFQRYITQWSTRFAGYVRDVEYDGNKVTLRCDNILVDLQQKIISQTWSGDSWETIIESLGDGTNCDLLANEATFDATVSSFVANNVSAWDVLQEICERLNAVFFVDPGAAGLKAVVTPTYDRGGGGSLAAGTSSSNIFGIPEWSDDSSELFNNITLYYSGGSATSSDSTSITNYGERQLTLYNKDIISSSDASTAVSNILTQYKDPKISVKCKVKQGIWQNTGVEQSPLGMQITVNDYVNDRTGSNYWCVEYEMRWPEKYDIITLGNLPVSMNIRTADIGRRVKRIEGAVNQNVNTDSTPTLSKLTLSSTDADSLNSAGGIDISGAADVGSVKISGTEVIDSSRDLKSIGSATLGATTISTYMKFNGYYDDPNTYGLISITPAAADKNVILRIFRDTNTTGSRQIHIFKGDGTPTTTIRIDANSGNITTVGTVDGVDVSAHAANKEAHHNLPAPFKKTNSGYTGFTGVETKTLATVTPSTGFTALQLLYAKLMSNNANFTTKIRITWDDDSTLNLTNADVVANNETETLTTEEILDDLGDGGKYIKSILVLGTSAVTGTYGWSYDLRGYQY